MKKINLIDIAEAVAVTLIIAVICVICVFCVLGAKAYVEHDSEKQEAVIAEVHVEIPADMKAECMALMKVMRTYYEQSRDFDELQEEPYLDYLVEMGYMTSSEKRAWKEVHR